MRMSGSVEELGGGLPGVVVEVLLGGLGCCEAATVSMDVVVKFDSRPIRYTRMCGHGRCSLSLDSARDRLWFGYVGCDARLWS